MGRRVAWKSVKNLCTDIIHEYRGARVKSTIIPAINMPTGAGSMGCIVTYMLLTHWLHRSIYINIHIFILINILCNHCAIVNGLISPKYRKLLEQLMCQDIVYREMSLFVDGLS